MRIPKFRAWDTLNKKMRLVLQIKWDLKDPTYLCISDENGNDWDIDQIILMQSIGVKDCNQQDIYAWDVVKNHKTQEVGIVYYCQAAKWKLTKDVQDLEYLLGEVYPSMDGGRKFSKIYLGGSINYEVLGSYWALKEELSEVKMEKLLYWTFTGRHIEKMNRNK